MTTRSADTGWLGEEATAQWLLEKGFSLRHRNWRQGRYELDIVASRGATLHFVEVKTRRAMGLTPPEQGIDYKKTRALTQAA